MNKKIMKERKRKRK